ncbi:hypothetical protein PQR21_00565 [Paraburkholderia nemoris]|uniref:hypothetical protein n=1 Tax=Paraburkholderia nemoris TaxID=2793076 RepID=UPI0038B8B1DF
MYEEFYVLVEEIEATLSLKVVTFESANPDFFIAHYSTAEPPPRDTYSSFPEIFRYRTSQ